MTGDYYTTTMINAKRNAKINAKRNMNTNKQKRAKEKRKRWLKQREEREKELFANGGAYKGYGVQPLVKPRGFKGTKLGAANSGKRLSAEERMLVEEQLRKEGKIWLHPCA